MTDHLEPYRRMARSIRFFPPLSLEQPPQESVALAGRPAIGSSSTSKTLADDYEISVLEPPIDPSEHVAALVQEAVSQPTVLPTTYAIQENIGDRISRLGTPKPPKPVTLSTIEFKIPQPVSESNGKSAHTIVPEPLKEDTNQKADTNLGASTAVTEVAQAPTVTEAPKLQAIEEDTNQQLEEIQPQPPETEVAQGQAVAEIPEPEAIKEDTNQQLEESQPQPPVTVVAEKPTVTEAPEPETIEEDTKKQIDDNHLEASAIVSTEALSVAQTPSDEAGEVVVEPSAVEETLDEEASAVSVVAPVSVEQTVDEDVVQETQERSLWDQGSKGMETGITALQQPAVEAQSTSPKTAETEPLKAEVVAATSKEAQVNNQESVTAKAEPVAIPPKETDVKKKPSDDVVVEAVPAVEKKASDSQTDEITCPQCESTNLKKNGRRAGKQRYVCKDCGKQFVAQIEEEPKQKESSSVKTEKIKNSEVETKLSNSSKRSSKKKTKAKGFGNSKV